MFRRVRVDDRRRRLRLRVEKASISSRTVTPSCTSISCRTGSVSSLRKFVSELDWRVTVPQMVRGPHQGMTGCQRSQPEEFSGADSTLISVPSSASKRSPSRRSDPRGKKIAASVPLVRVASEPALPPNIKWQDKLWKTFQVSWDRCMIGISFDSHHW